MDDVGRLGIFIFFLIMSFIFSSVCICLRNINISKLEDDMDENEIEVSGNLEKLFKTPLIKQWTTFNIMYVLNTIFSVMSLKMIVEYYFEDVFKTWAFYNEFLGYEICHVLILLCVSAVVLVLTLSVPQKIFADDSEKNILKVYSLAYCVGYIYYPVVFLINLFGKIIAMMFGFNKEVVDKEITQEHIRYLIDASEDNGDIEEEEREMINNIFDFDEKTVAELMTHRKNVTAVEICDTLSEVINEAIENGFSRIPVYENDIDNIKGIIYVKDLLCLIESNSLDQLKISDFMRDVIYVPEAKKCIDLFNSFKAKKAHMAVVVDDYGGTAGIITMENLLEAIVGNIQDEYDDEKEEVTKIDDKTYILEGGLSLEKVEKFFDIEFDSEDDTDTLGGFLVNSIGQIPLEGEHPFVIVENIKFTIILVEERRASRIKCELMDSKELIEI